MSHLLPWEAVWSGEMHLLQVKSHVSLEPCLWFPCEPQSWRQHTIYSSKELSGGKVFIISIFFEITKGCTYQVSIWLFLLIVSKSWISGSLWRQLPVHFTCGHLVLWRCILKDGLSHSWMVIFFIFASLFPGMQVGRGSAHEWFGRDLINKEAQPYVVGWSTAGSPEFSKVWCPSSSLNRDSILAYIDLWGPLEPS